MNVKSITKEKIINYCTKHLNKISILAWVSLTLYILIFIIMKNLILKNNPHDYTITWIYWDASLKWIKGIQMYSIHDPNFAFVYFPQSAILQIPFAILPYTLTEIIWRILNISLLIWACYSLARLWKSYLPINLSFFVISLFTLPLSYDALRNGQINILLAIIICFVTYSLVKEKYKTAVILCFIGLALKPYMIIPLILVLGVYPKRTFWTAVICAIVFVLSPFAFQSPQYVLQQYKTCFLAFQTQNLAGLNIGYSNIFGLRKVVGLTISETAVTIISVFAGLIIYIYSLIYLKRAKNYIAPAIMMTLGITFILLFGPKTEFNTYCIAGPFMGFLVVGGLLYKRWIYVSVSLTCWIIMFSANALHKIITPHVNIGNSWPAPLAFAIFMIISLIFVLPIIMQKFQTVKQKKTIKP